MPDARISALPTASLPIAGTEVLPIVQSGVTDQITAADLLRQNGQTVTTSNPVLSLAQTWNAGGVTFTGLKFNATDTASAAPSILLDLQVGGVSVFSVGKTGGFSTSASSMGIYNNSAAIYMGGSGDVVLARDAANALALRNSTNAQGFRSYKTYTDASNYERLELGLTGYGSSAMGVLARASGSGDGTVPLVVGTFGAANLGLLTNNTLRWQVAASTGHFLANVDNTYDIGAAGANRPRSVYVAGTITLGGSTVMGSTAALTYGARTTITSPADGLLLLQNNAATDFTRLQFGGTTSAFPALLRTGTALQAQLADGSARAGFECATLGATSTISSSGLIHAYTGTAVPVGGTAGVGVRVSSATNFGVFFGSGVPTLSAAQGSLYLRSDGSSTSTRMYVNTDSATGWTAVTTAA